MTRREKIERWEKIYAQALDVIEKYLGTDDRQLYAACHVIQNASREIKVIGDVMFALGELDIQKRANFDTIGWGDISDSDEAITLADA